MDIYSNFFFHFQLQEILFYWTSISIASCQFSNYNAVKINIIYLFKDLNYQHNWGVQGQSVSLFMLCVLHPQKISSWVIESVFEENGIAV